MTFDPDAPDAHADSRTDPPATKTSRPAASDAETRAAQRIQVVSLDGTLKGWDAGFAASAAAQFARTGRLTDAQWKHVTRIARCAPLVKRPVHERPSLEREMDDVEAQLDAILADPQGDRCVLANDEMGTGRAKSIARALGASDDGDGPLAGTPRLPGYGFGQCGTCFLGPSRGCARCARGEPHPGQACDSPHRSKVCRGLAYLAHLRANAVGGDEGALIREEMGLIPPDGPSGPETTETKP